jgi:hypothetical protein
MKQDDIQEIVKNYYEQMNPEHRYTSFDYCYNYFKTTSDLTKDMEKSCHQLGFYLASWGMYRGKSFLLQKSVKIFEPIIHYISTLTDSDRKIDADNYDLERMEKIQEIYSEIKSKLIYNDETELTLITKILLGVFGFIPAFDNYFCKAFRVISNGDCGFRRLNNNSLSVIKKFYNGNKAVIDALSENIFTIDYETGQKTEIKYPKAKIIDMYGFIKGKLMEEEEKKNKNGKANP